MPSGKYVPLCPVSEWTSDAELSVNHVPSSRTACSRTSSSWVEAMRVCARNNWELDFLTSAFNMKLL